MQSCPVCDTKVNVISIRAVDTVVAESEYLGTYMGERYYHVKGRQVRCIKCRKEFLIITHKKLLVPINETPKG